MAATKTMKVSNIKLVESTATSGQLIATWDAPSGVTNLKEYKYVWQIWDASKWRDASSGTTTSRTLYYSYGEAPKVRIKICPVEKAKKDLSESAQKSWVKWSGEYVTSSAKQTKAVNPEVPGVPTITFNSNYTKWTATVTVTDTTATEYVGIYVQDSNGKLVDFVDEIKPKNGTVTASGTFSALGLKVRAKAYAWNATYNTQSSYTAWSEYTASLPSVPTGVKVAATSTENQAKVSWTAVTSATSYTVEYAPNKNYFGTGNSNVKTQTATTNSAYIDGLEYGTTYYFRVSATNSVGTTGYSSIVSITLASTPEAPTTWSSVENVIAGNTVTMYWIHNSADDSDQTAAQVQIYIDGTLKTTKTFTTETSYDYDTSALKDGQIITWRAQTKGAAASYSAWSVLRAVTVRTAPSLGMVLIDSEGGDIEDETVTSYPFTISAYLNPITQHNVSEELIIQNVYDIVQYNLDGTQTFLPAGSVIAVQTEDQVWVNAMSYIFNATDSLVDQETYRATLTVGTDQGLSCSNSLRFTMNLDSSELDIDADIVLGDDLSATITPYCESDTEAELSVYRLEADGTYQLILSGMKSGETTADLHPRLDATFYRITAVSSTTGKISVADFEGEGLNEKSLVIQWDEAGTAYSDEDGEISYTKTMLKLPYNVSVDQSNEPDRTLAKYIGRKRPVSYFGTQMGEKQSWSASFKKADSDTLFLARKLQSYQGNVYVREPSGTGYWAVVEVSISQKYSSGLADISIDITRVEGGA